METLIITGAAGFVGQNVTQELKKHYKIIAIDKHKENLELLQTLNPEIKTINTDLSKKGSWEKEFEKADYVLQLHAQIASQEKKPFVNNNVKATKNVIEASKKIKYTIHFSSAAVVSIRKDDYAETKEKGEELIKNSKLKYSAIRPSMMYGCFDNKNVGWLLNFLKKTPIFPIVGTGKYPRQPVYIKDITNIILKLLEKQPKNKIYSINGDPIDFIDMVKEMMKASKRKRILIKLPIGLFIFLMKTYNFIFRKVEFTEDQVKSLTTGETFGMEPWWDELKIKKTSFKEGLEDMVQDENFKYILKR